MVPEFANEPLTDFARSAPDRQAMETALREVKGEFAREWPLIIEESSLAGISILGSPAQFRIYQAPSCDPASCIFPHSLIVIVSVARAHASAESNNLCILSSSKSEANT